MMAATTIATTTTTQYETTEHPMHLRPYRNCAQEQQATALRMKGVVSKTPNGNQLVGSNHSANESVHERVTTQHNTTGGARDPRHT
eukprot:jgi/Psemu1/314548/fgenesh1_kg.1592_\